ncbi:MAG: Ty1/Copia family ribonuclease HI, partial [bacterium]
TLWCDNKAAIELSVNPKFHSRTKHIGKIYHLVRVLGECGIVTVVYVNTTENLADIFTKAVGIRILESFTVKVHGNGIIEYNRSNMVTVKNGDYK